MEVRRMFSDASHRRGLERAFHGVGIRIAAHLRPPRGCDLCFERRRSALPVPLFVVTDIVQGWCVTGVQAAVKLFRYYFSVGPAFVGLVAGFTVHLARL